ncbi:uncharacterized protein PGTG_12750 [Puccinia graminis f. sp. tritici CRL 75-36-700-3]|uniref:Uncharacterized protein n=1 Tax=Puccinia graminis f. sp. tritici (strain CRL 75-36-700-3 / race SCCL) TaxID=418459 RepID=E3KRT4_PUCGT|nr:uncharacterized protein PGTG_12750 [Puccinia graminis f. sp. tritici CRL 75-36-700-3]EFP87009.2 hypothetical protein PGTG_12750 [Puccinia graminis f. sp. tritici CRL 75-36-700-3]
MYHAGCNIVPRPVRDRLDKSHRRIGSHFLGGEVRHGELKSGSESEIRAMTVDCGPHWNHAASLLAETSKTSCLSFKFCQDTDSGVATNATNKLLKQVSDHIEEQEELQADQAKDTVHTSLMEV